MKAMIAPGVCPPWMTRKPLTSTTPAMARPASVSMIGLVPASSAAIELARLSTSDTALCMRPRINCSRLKDLTMRTPTVVSCITWTIWASDRNSASMILRTRRRIWLTP